MNHITRSPYTEYLRPGMGGATPAPLQQRLPIWLETVPVLLAHLKTPHVTLLSHSAGAIFLLNTLYTYPQILHPQTPTAILLAPWVHPSDSDVGIMKFSSMIPDTLIINYWASLCLGTVKILQNAVNPAVASSSGAYGTVASLFKSDATKGKSERENRELEETYVESFGMGVKDKKEFDRLFRKYVFAEDMSGGNGEAMLCLKKGGSAGSWGVCDNYHTFVPELAAVWRRYLDFGHGNSDAAVESKPKLKIQAYFAEDDIMIGKKGQRYVETSFSSPTCEDVLDFESFTIEGANHETIGDPTFGPIETMFGDVKERSG